MTETYFTYVMAPLYFLFIILMFIMNIGIYRVASAHTADTKKPKQVWF